MSSSDDAPQSHTLGASRRPRRVASESPLRSISREDVGVATPDLSPRSARTATADLARCSGQVAQLQRELSLVSSSDEDDGVEWDPTGKTIDEINAFLKKWEKDCRNTNYARIAKENAAYKEQLKAKKASKAAMRQAKARIYTSEEEDEESDEVICEDEVVDEEKLSFYAGDDIPGADI